MGPTTNPLTRTSSKTQSDHLLEDMAAGASYDASNEFAEVFSKGEPVSIVELQSILRENECSLYTVAKYDLQQCACLSELIVAARQSGQRPRFSAVAAVRCMGGGASIGSNYSGLTSARRAADRAHALAAALNDPLHSFADLACFLCMLNVS